MMVMISYGHRPGNKVIEKGNFICPLCCRKRQYKRYKVIKEEFYGIISIPLGEIGQYIECQSCLRPFPIKVLSSSAQLSIKIENTPLPPSNIMEIWQNAYTTLKGERLLSSKTPITDIVEGISPVLLTIAHHMQDAGVKIRLQEYKEARRYFYTILDLCLEHQVANLEGNFQLQTRYPKAHKMILDYMTFSHVLLSRLPE